MLETGKYMNQYGIAFYLASWTDKRHQIPVVAWNIGEETSAACYDKIHPISKAPSSFCHGHDSAL